MLRNVFVALLLLAPGYAFTQFTLSGKITDEENKVLTGATILLDESGASAITNAEGDFALKNVSGGNHNLLVSFIGYQTISREINIDKDQEINLQLSPKTYWGEEVIVKATRAHDNTPTTYSEVDKKTISSGNLGQDLPVLLGMEPSLVFASDAGAGVGYTSMWIRGSNIQRINVTVNGVPINDPESHGVFWVNMPDMASSLQSVQIQRGVGTSSNGGGAFGATMNLETNYSEQEAYGQLSSSFGSFNTFKNTVQLGTGLIKDRWILEGRASSISSDGYIDRSASDLKSYFLQGGYYGKSTSVKAIVFGGKEKTGQAWNGNDSATMATDRTFNSSGAIYDEAWNITGFYKDETDNYQQDHYQLHVSQKINPNWLFNGALHYTYGRGFYEQYYSNKFLDDYPIGLQYFGYDSIADGSNYNYFYHDTISSGDMIVRRWLDNHFYGTTFAFHYTGTKLQFTFGGGYNKFANSKHFGEIIWAEYSGNSNIGDTFYDNVANKTDLNNYAKINFSLTAELNAFVDLQIRHIIYEATGMDKGNYPIDIDKTYTFFNPKAGISYSSENIGTIYTSWAMAHREPIRSDFLDAPEGITPEPEILHDFEAGIRKHTGNYHYSANGYLMLYTNQLVLTGELNDVGAPVRANVGNSYRLGVELDGGVKLNEIFSIRTNISLNHSSTDYKSENEEEIAEFQNVPLTYSPLMIGGFEVIASPIKQFELALNGKYVSRQYLDLTQTDRKSLDPYFINNMRFSYSFTTTKVEECKLSLQLNNLFNTMYVANAYLWGETPYYYPQAGLHLMIGIDLRF